MDEQRLKKWRLILGRPSDPEGAIGLSGASAGMDDSLDALYDSDRQGRLGASSPNINRWLGDIRRYFPTPVVQVLQRDALDRLGLKQMLLEPELLESVVPDVDLVATLLTLNKMLPEQTRATARELVSRLAGELMRKLREPLREAVAGTLHRAVRHRTSRAADIDWHRTIRANLRLYQPEYKTIIPEKLYGYGRRGPHLRHLILLVDQSASMATSVVHSGIAGSILASLPSVRTDFIAFDTQVVNLTDQLDDPVDLLFGAQLGGGTDIGRAVGYARQLVRRPADTLLFLISDLFEGGNPEELIAHAGALQASGVRVVCLLALDDHGTPAYDKKIAAHLASLDIPAFACTPEQFPGLLATAIGKGDIRAWMEREGIALKN